MWDVVSHWIYFGLNWPIDWGSGHGHLRWEQPYRSVLSVVIDEKYPLLIDFDCCCRRWTAHIKLYQFTGLHTVLDWHSYEPVFVLGLDTDYAHRIIVCTSTNQKNYCGRILIGYWVLSYSGPCDGERTSNGLRYGSQKHTLNTETGWICSSNLRCLWKLDCGLDFR